MGILDYFKKQSPAQIAARLPEDVLRVEMVSRSTSNNGHSAKIVNTAKSLRAKNLKDWTNAVASATDPDEPDTTALHELYDSLMLDAHLAGAIESRMLKVQRSKFQIVDQSGKEVEELTQLLKRPFFSDFIEAAMWTKFRGAQLLELMELHPLTLELRKGFRFPEQHVNFVKRIVLKEVGDTTGFPFEGGSVDKYYLCFGEPRKLGLLADIAQVVILKKSAVAAWAEFVERFGVPPRIGKVRPGDDVRAKEVAAMLENMVSSTWAVLETDEEFEIANIKMADAHQTFDRLIDRCNSEISKRVLGASGTTDEKAHVGAANVHYEIASDRYMSDKAMVEYLVNQELIPRLTQISSVYSPLANHHFRWDEMEDLKPLEYGELISTLSLNFELDLEEVSEKTGMKVLGHKYVNGGGGDADALPNPDAPKKKAPTLK